MGTLDFTILIEPEHLISLMILLLISFLFLIFFGGGGGGGGVERGARSW